MSEAVVDIPMEDAVSIQNRAGLPPNPEKVFRSASSRSATYYHFQSWAGRRVGDDVWIDQWCSI
jgi:hypothetical protein